MSNLFLKFNKFEFTDTANEHINKMPFSGVCMFAEKPSDGVPCGADKPVRFTREAVETALSSFVGMGVNCRYDPWLCPEDALTGHDEHFKIGVVEKAELLADGSVYIEGILWKHDLYDCCFMIQNAKDALGFSVEVFVQNMRDAGDALEVNDFMFTGVSILYKNLAAFKTTQIAAQAKKKETDVMTKEELDAVLGKFDEVTAKFEESLNAVADKLDALASKETTVDFSEVTASIKELGEKLNAVEIKAEEKKDEVPVPKTETTKFAGKEDDVKTELTLSERIAEIENDVKVDPAMKARLKVQAFIDMQKKSK